MPQSPIPVIVQNSAAAGHSWFVNETSGLDTNSGTAQSPFKTLTKAQAAATANNNDVVYFSGTIHQTAALTWAKNGVSLVGLTAPSDNDRARISSSGSAVFSPLVSVTAQGCSFVNVGTFYGFNDASTQVCWSDTGGRNFYSACQFLGGGDATAAAQAGMRSLVIGGSGENLFVGCTIGLDTVVRATNANASLEFISGTPRNRFERCVFQMLTSLATNVHVTVGADGLDRYALFDDCAFINAVESTSTTINAAITANAAAGGAVMLQHCISLGATALATAGPVYVVGTAPVATTASIAIKAT